MTPERSLRFGLFVDDHVGHAHAMTGVARRLRSFGHEVKFFGPGGMLHHIEKAGFQYNKEPFLSPTIGSPCARNVIASSGDCRTSLFARAEAVLDGAQRLIAAHMPDLIVFDPFLLCHYPAFARLGVKAVAVSTKPLLTPDALVPPYTSGVIPPRSGSRWSWRVAAAWRRQRLAYAVYRARCLKDEWLRGWSHRSLTLAVARATGFPLQIEWATRPLSWDLRFRSVPELVLHAREFELPRRHPIDGSGAFIGPCVDMPTLPTELDLPPGDGPLFYCYFGSVFGQQAESALASYRAVLEALREEPSWRAVIATGRRAVTERLSEETRSLREQIVLRDWIPRGAALALADVAVIHGGANSVKEAILAGRPILALPRGADQPGVAARIAYHGLGLVAASATGGAVRTGLHRLLNDRSFRRRIIIMRDYFMRYDSEQVCERVLTAAALGRVPRFGSELW